MRQLPLALVLLLAIASPAFSQTATPAATITMIRTGWGADSFAVVLSTGIVNPKSCPAADGYESWAAYPGHNTYFQAALAAYIAKRPVSVTVDKNVCSSSGRPAILGINIQ